MKPGYSVFKEKMFCVLTAISLLTSKRKPKKTSLNFISFAWCCIISIYLSIYLSTSMYSHGFFSFFNHYHFFYIFHQILDTGFGNKERPSSHFSVDCRLK